MKLEAFQEAAPCTHHALLSCFEVQRNNTEALLQEPQSHEDIDKLASQVVRSRGPIEEVRTTLKRIMTKLTNFLKRAPAISDTGDAVGAAAAGGVHVVSTALSLPGVATVGRRGVPSAGPEGGARQGEAGNLLFHFAEASAQPFPDFDNAVPAEGDNLDTPANIRLPSQKMDRVTKNLPGSIAAEILTAWSNTAKQVEKTKPRSTQRLVPGSVHQKLAEGIFERVLPPVSLATPRR